MTSPRVVIVGAGFGGLECARRLARRPVDVLLLDRNNYHLFTPLLYQVASSLLNPSDIAYPVRAALRGAPNVRFRLAEVSGVDLAAREVITSDGSRVPFDYLVLAAGAATSFFGLREVEEHALALKDLVDALDLRDQILRAFEAAARAAAEAERRRWLTFVVVGGGPTGVEYAGALSELARRAMVRDFPELDMGSVRIFLVEAAARVLPLFDPAQGRHAQEELERKGVQVRLGARVEGARPDGVRLAGGEWLDAATLIWTAGVRPSPLAAAAGLPRSRSGRIEVDGFLRVKGEERIFAIGDIAAAVQAGAELPMMIPQARQEARAAARNILRAAAGMPPVAFRYRSYGVMATIGRNAAVARIGPVSLKGFPGWVAWLFLHLVMLIGFRNRLVVLLGWAWDYVRYDRPIRIIGRSRDRNRGQI